MFVSLLTTEQQQQQQQQEHVDRLTDSSRGITEIHLESEPTSIIIVDGAASSHGPKEDTRETWSSNCDYLITTLGGLIGLGTYPIHSPFLSSLRRRQPERRNHSRIYSCFR